MKITRLALLIGIILAVGTDAYAQQTSEYVTWVHFVHVNPGRDADFIDLFTKLNRERLDAHMADGTIVSWGVAVPFSKRDPSWTHFVWISFVEWADMDTVMAGFGEADSKRSEEERTANTALAHEILDFDATRDLVLRHVVVPSGTMQQEPKGPPAYFKLAFYKVHPEHTRAAVELYEEIAKPTYDGLVEKGQILDFALTVQELASDPEWTHVSWQILPDLDALDVMRRARKKADDARPAPEQAEIMMNMREYIDFEDYRSELCRIAVLGGQ